MSLCPTGLPAVVRLMELSADEKTRLLYEAREKERMDNESRIEWERSEGERSEREKWQGIVAEKDAHIAEKDARIAELEAQLANQNK